MTVCHFWNTTDRMQFKYPCGAVDPRRDGHRAENVNCKKCRQSKEWRFWNAYCFFEGDTIESYYLQRVYFYKD